MIYQQPLVYQQPWRHNFVRLFLQLRHVSSTYFMVYLVSMQVDTVRPLDGISH